MSINIAFKTNKVMNAKLINTNKLILINEYKGDNKCK